jgi:hypothetical protein
MSRNSFIAALILSVMLSPIAAHAITLNSCVRDALRSALIDKNYKWQQEWNNYLRKTGIKVANFIAETKHLPTPSTDADLAARLSRFENNPIFLKALKENPEAWKILQELYASPERNTALEAIAYLKNHDSFELADDELKKNIAAYKDDAKFIDTVRTNTKAREFFQIKDDTVPKNEANKVIRYEWWEKEWKSYSKKTAQKLIDFILENKHLPTSTSDEVLSTQLDRLKKHPDFLKLIKRNNEAWKIYEELSVSAAKNTAMEAIAYLKKFGDLKYADKRLKKRISDHKDNPDFASLVESDPKAREYFQAKSETSTQAKEKPKPIPRIKGADAARAAANEVIDFLLKHQSLPSNAYDPKIYMRMYKQMEKPEFLETLRQNPEAWRLYQESKVAFKYKRQSAAMVIATQPRAAAEQLSVYLQEPESATIPLEIKRRALFNKWRLQKNNPEFIDEIKKDPTLWNRLQEAQTIGARQAAKDVIEFLSKPENSRLSPYEKIQFFWRFDAYKLHPEFLKIMSENHEDPSHFLEKLKLTDYEKAAEIVMSYVAQYGRLPEEKTARRENYILHFYKSHPAFVGAIQNDYETWGQYIKAFHPQP